MISSVFLYVVSEWSILQSKLMRFGALTKPSRQIRLLSVWQGSEMSRVPTATLCLCLTGPELRIRLRTLWVLSLL